MSFTITTNQLSEQQTELIGPPETVRPSYLIEAVGEDEAVLNDIADILSSHTKDDHIVKIGVLLNTVRRAQEYYNHLADWIDISRTDIVLIHSRYTVSDRLKKESEVFKLVGKNAKPTKNVVIISTQVAEQSLDIDFDIMWSDISPIENLIQRCGRIHRHIANSRPSQYEDPTLKVIINEESLKYSSLIYGTYPIAVAEAWTDETRTFSFNTISTAVDGAYQQQARFPEEYKEWENETKTRTQAAEEYRIASPYNTGSTKQSKLKHGLYGWLMKAGNSISEIVAEAKVRDGDSGPTFILVEQTPEGDWKTHDSKNIPITDSMSLNQQRHILKSSITFPRMKEDRIMRIVEQAEQPPASLLTVWNNTPLLAGEIPFIMQKIEGTTDLIGDSYMYSYERGLEEI